MMIRRWLAALLVCLTALPAAGGGSSKTVPVVPGKAGTVTRDYTPAGRKNWRGAEEHSLHVVVWYPAAEDASPTRQVLGPGGTPWFEAGSVMPHAAFAPSLEKRPLVLLSPGFAGPAEQMAWLGVALAHAGFVAAALDHPGADALPRSPPTSAGTASADGEGGRGSLTAAGYTLWWERATDLSDALDGLLADPELSKYIDRGRVGAAGFSLGGYTVLEVGGARTDVSQFYDRCQKGADNPACRVPAGLQFPVSAFAERDAASPESPKKEDARKAPSSPEQVLEAVRKGNQESLARSGDSYRDSRVRAVLALAPEYAFTLTPESLRHMRLPVLVVSGAEDRVVPVADSAAPLHGALHGGRVTVLPGVGHFTFLDSCTAAGKVALPELCTDGAGVDREAVHMQVGAIAVEFFDRALR